MSEEELRVLNRDSPERTHDTQCSTPGTPSAKGLKVTEIAAGARLKGRPAHWNGMVGSNLSAPERAGCANVAPSSAKKSTARRPGQGATCRLPAGPR